MSTALEAAEAALRAADPGTALRHLTEAVRAKPADPRLRVFLVQLLCVLGHWERAHTQLNVAAELDAKAGPMREMVGHALRCELMRAQVFAGRRTPMVFGQPDEWLALLIESLLQAGSGNAALATSLADRAFEAAPPSSGHVGEVPFAWLADGDSRLGPVLEAFVNGRYYWVPFARLLRVDFEAPTDLRDMVWLPAQLTFDNGGEVIALVPSRYPGTPQSDDGALQLARKTAWTDAGDGRWFGIGQRVLTSDAGEHDLLSLRSLQFDALPAAAEAA